LKLAMASRLVACTLVQLAALPWHMFQWQPPDELSWPGQVPAAHARRLQLRRASQLTPVTHTAHHLLPRVCSPVVAMWFLVNAMIGEPPTLHLPSLHSCICASEHV